MPNKPSQKTIVRINERIMTTLEIYLKKDITRLLEAIAHRYGKTYGFKKKDLVDEFLPKDTILLPIVEKTKKNVPCED